ncbi:MAG: hypothetical protein CMK59_10580 [Proteobacteria bacterium]|nr:hypothetical protein [Pseudomonadota bacterium]
MNKEQIHICKSLRWKGSQQLRKNPEQLRLALFRNEVQYSCLKTFQVWGPDGNIAAPEKCVCTRKCYKEQKIPLVRVNKRSSTSI